MLGTGGRHSVRRSQKTSGGASRTPQPSGLIRSPRIDACGGFTPDVEIILKQQKTLDVLRRLAVLHHGRNLRAILECWRDARNSGAAADERTEDLRAGIAARMAHAEERYRGGMIFAAPPSGSEFVGGRPALGYSGCCSHRRVRHRSSG